MIRKNIGLIYAERFTEDLERRVDDENIKVRGYVEAFDNCREQGYKVYIRNYKFDI